MATKEENEDSLDYIAASSCPFFFFSFFLSFPSLPCVVFLEESQQFCISVGARKRCILSILWYCFATPLHIVTSISARESQCSSVSSLALCCKKDSVKDPGIA